MINPILTPTPVQEILWPEAHGNRIFLKRDDLLPFSFGGNKVRIGLAFFRDMTRKNANAMIMYGSPRSNLCRVLAGLCAGAGIPALMISAEDHPSGEDAFNERIVKKLGCRVLHCQKSGIPEAVDKAIELFALKGRTPYYIYGNRYGTGNEAAAAYAYAEACGEILGDMEMSGLVFDYLYTPYGTGATMGGLAAGAIERAAEEADAAAGASPSPGRKPRMPYIVGISISSRTPGRAEQVLRTTVESYLKQRDIALPGDMDRFFRLECGYNAGGYGQTDPGIDLVIEKMLTRHSVPMDPTYTGKAFRGMLLDLEARGITGRNILFLHTGGLPLFFDYLRKD